MKKNEEVLSLHYFIAVTSSENVNETWTKSFYEDVEKNLRVIKEKNEKVNIVKDYKLYLQGPFFGPGANFIKNIEDNSKTVNVILIAFTTGITLPISILHHLLKNNFTNVNYIALYFVANFYELTNYVCTVVANNPNPKVKKLLSFYKKFKDSEEPSLDTLLKTKFEPENITSCIQEDDTTKGKIIDYNSDNLNLKIKVMQTLKTGIKGEKEDLKLSTDFINKDITVCDANGVENWILFCGSQSGYKLLDFSKIPNHKIYAEAI